MRTSFTHDIEVVAKTRGIDPDLIEALVMKESGGHPYAYNPEPRYRWLWDVKLRKPFRPLQPDEATSEVPPSDFWALAGDRDQEWWAQQASWGLMQIMGSLARELGFMGPYIPEICRPDVNLELGVKHLSDLVKRAGGDYTKALAAYNAGWGGKDSPVGLAYASSVLSIVDQL